MTEIRGFCAQEVSCLEFSHEMRRRPTGSASTPVSLKENVTEHQVQVLKCNLKVLIKFEELHDQYLQQQSDTASTTTASSSSSASPSATKARTRRQAKFRETLFTLVPQRSFEVISVPIDTRSLESIVNSLYSGVGKWFERTDNYWNELFDFTEALTPVDGVKWEVAEYISTDGVSVCITKDRVKYIACEANEQPSNRKKRKRGPTARQRKFKNTEKGELLLLIHTIS